MKYYCTIDNVKLKSILNKVSKKTGTQYKVAQFVQIINPTGKQDTLPEDMEYNYLNFMINEEQFNQLQVGKYHDLYVAVNQGTQFTTYQIKLIIVK